MAVIKQIPFDRSDAKFKEVGERGISHAIAEGRMKEADATLIRNFIQQLRATQNIGVRRGYKILNALTNSTRFFKTPFTENTIYDLYEGFENLKHGKKTQRINKKITLPDGTEKTVTELIQKDEPLAQNTIRDYQMFVKRFYLWLIDEELCSIRRDKVKDLKPVSQVKITKTADDILSEEQVKAMLDACQNSRDRALIGTLYEGAFRIGEIAGMTWQDVDFSDKHFCTARTDFKTGNERIIPLHIARGYLLTWKNDYPGDASGNNPVFVSRYNTSLRYTGVKFQLNAIAKRAGIEKHITPHIFRHSRITHMIKDGWTDSTVKSIAWGNLETGCFSTYCHLSKRDILNEARKQNGIEAPEEDSSTDAMKARQCPRCLTLNTPTQNFCSVCGAPLTEAVAIDLQSMKEEIHEDGRYKKVVGDLERKVEAMELFS